jgi:hypothetical protein
MENYNIIGVFFSVEKPIFIPYYISDKLFIIEIAWQYKFWFPILSKKRKNKFIPLPWKFGKIILWRISKIDEYVAYFENSDLNFAKEIQDFDPNPLFYNHLLSVQLGPTFLKSAISKEEENGSHHPSDQELDRNSEEIEIVIITIEHNKERGRPSNEKSVQSPVVSRRSALPKANPQPRTSHARKIHSTNSGDDEDRNPPKANQQNPQKLKAKIKRTSSQQEGDETHAQKDDLLLDGMDLDVDI